MMWADRYVADSSNYVLFLDCDSVFGMPVTRSSLFDDRGEPYQVSWPIDNQLQFKKPCLDMIKGGSCERSYMSTFPFVMPKHSFLPMREHIALSLRTLNLTSGTLNSTKDVSNLTFDYSFDLWTRNVSYWNDFSQFVVMGEYMRVHRSHEVTQVFCPDLRNLNGSTLRDVLSQNAETQACLNYVPPAVHLGWGNDMYLHGGMGKSYRHQNAGEFAAFSQTFGVSLINAVEEILFHGNCLQDHFMGEKYPRECSGVDMKTILPDLNLYGNHRSLNWTLVMQTFNKTGDYSHN